MRLWTTRAVGRLLERDLELHADLVFGSGAEDPALGLSDGAVVDAGLPPPHQPVGVELPQLVAIAAEPLSLGIMRLVLEAHRDPVIGEGPQALAQRVVQLAVPLGR